MYNGQICCKNESTPSGQSKSVYTSVYLIPTNARAIILLLVIGEVRWMQEKKHFPPYLVLQCQHCSSESKTRLCLVTVKCVAVSDAALTRSWDTATHSESSEPPSLSSWSSSSFPLTAHGIDEPRRWVSILVEMQGVNVCFLNLIFHFSFPAKSWWFCASGQYDSVGAWAKNMIFPEFWTGLKFLPFLNWNVKLLKYLFSFSN